VSITDELILRQVFPKGSSVEYAASMATKTHSNNNSLLPLNWRKCPSSERG